MIKRIFIICIIYILHISGLATTHAQVPISTSIYKIKHKPLEFDNKIVRVCGWTITGPMGIGLRSEDQKDDIRLIWPVEEIEDLNLPVNKDGLYNQFMKQTAVESEFLDYRIHVELDGMVRTLQHNGRIVKEYDIFKQFPIEIIILNIRKITLIKGDVNIH